MDRNDLIGPSKKPSLDVVGAREVLQASRNLIETEARDTCEVVKAGPSLIGRIGSDGPQHREI